MITMRCHTGRGLSIEINRKLLAWLQIFRVLGFYYRKYGWDLARFSCLR